MSITRDLCEPVPTTSIRPGRSVAVLTLSLAAFKAKSMSWPSWLAMACCTSSMTSTTSPWALRTSSTKTSARVTPPGVPRPSRWTPRLMPAAPKFTRLTRRSFCSSVEAGCSSSEAAARTASCMSAIGGRERSVHRSTYSTSAPWSSSAGTKSCRMRVVLPMRRIPERNTPERSPWSNGPGTKSCCANARA